MADYAPVVKLPGKMYRVKGRWRWRVRLPGERRIRARALKPEGSRVGTRKKTEATNIAFELYLEAVREQAKADCGQTVSSLKARFLEKTQDLSGISRKMDKKVRKYEQELAEARARLDRIADVVAETFACECCGTNGFSIYALHHIDSGQLLCADCLESIKTHAAASGHTLFDI